MNRTALLFTTLSLTACIVGDDPQPMTYDQFVARYISQEPDAAGTVHMFYDWDVPVSSMEDVQKLYAAYRTVHETGQQVSASIVLSQNGADVIWSPADRTNLSYCVADSFAGFKPAVVAALATATGAWQTASGDRIRYVYNAAHDANCTNANTAVTFNVIPIQANNGLFARAFFPNDVRANREVLINLTNVFAPNPAFPIEGILRHELGHSLGLRHETIRPDTAEEFGNQCLEGAFFRDVTKFFDDESVMITPACLGIAEVLDSNPKLELSFFDERGIRKIYR